MQDNRKDVRRPFERTAWIVPDKGNNLIKCVLKDMSRTGARLCVPPQQAIPQSFVLNLAANGAVARKCIIVWKSEAGDEIGVEFLARRISTVARPVIEVPV
jgi:hypothetical protein